VSRKEFCQFDAGQDNLRAYRKRTDRIGAVFRAKNGTENARFPVPRP